MRRAGIGLKAGTELDGNEADDLLCGGTGEK